MKKSLSLQAAPIHDIPNCVKRSAEHSSRRKSMKQIKKFLKDEAGMETLEYAVIAGLIAAVAVVVYASGWGNTLLTRLTNASNTN